MSWPKLRKCLWEAVGVLHVDRTIIIKVINLCNVNFVEFGIVFNAFVKEKDIIQEPKMPTHSYTIFAIVVMTNFWVFLSIMYKTMYFRVMFKPNVYWKSLSIEWKVRKISFKQKLERGKKVRMTCSRTSEAKK